MHEWVEEGTNHRLIFLVYRFSRPLKLLSLRVQRAKRASERDSQCSIDCTRVMQRCIWFGRTRCGFACPGSQAVPSLKSMDGDCVKPVRSAIELFVVFNDPWYVSRHTGAGAGGAAVWRVLQGGLTVGKVKFGSMYCANNHDQSAPPTWSSEYWGRSVLIICRWLALLCPKRWTDDNVLLL